MNSKKVFLISLFMACGIFSGAVIAQPPVKSDFQDSTPSDSELFATELAQLEDSEGENETEASRIFIPTAANDLLNLNFRETDIRGLISALAMQREINVVMSKDISGTVSVHLFNVTLEKALAAITLAGGFTFQKYEDLYYIYKPPKVEDPQQAKLKMWIYKLKYIKVEKVQEILKAFPEMGLIKIHGPSKTVIVQDTPENIEKLENLISHLDTAPKQVLIEAKILEITLTDDMLLGVDWSKLLGDVALGTQGFSRAVLPTAATAPISPVPASGSGAFGNVITATGTSKQFAAAVDALQTITNVNTLSTPKILAIHGEKARVQVGGQQGYRVTTTIQNVTTETIEFIDTGTTLEITPYINEEGFILLNVHPNITSAEIQLGGIPVTKTTVVSTWLLAKDGETAFIGGLIRDTKTRGKSMIPCLGSIPTIGVLFGQTQNTINKTELVILITTRIVDTEVKRESREARDKIRDLEEKIKKDVEQPHKDFFK
jgi:type II secretory pathway component GspD/PulD (secretin)